MQTIDKIGYLILVVIFGIAIYAGFANPLYFNAVLAVEDGPVETGTTLMLLLVCGLCWYRLVFLWGAKPALWKACTFLWGLLFFFAAGEEISWGQRLLRLQPGEFFLENNAQSETNLHNLVVSGKKINKLIFSQLLLVVLIVYLIIVPFIYRKTKRFQTLVNQLAIPVVKWHYTVAFATATLLVVLIPADRKWEVYELAIGFIFFLIFLNPLNKTIYKK